MKTLIKILVILIVISINCKLKAQEDISNGIVRICTNSGSFAVTIGTGFFIGKDTIITCYHVINKDKPFDSVFVYAENGKFYSIKEYISYLDRKEGDIMIFKINNPDSDLFKIFKFGKNISDGDSVNVWGFPLDNTKILFENFIPPLHKSTGKIINFSNKSKTMEYEISYTNYGASGSPVFDKNYNVVGIHHSKHIRKKIGYGTNFNNIQKYNILNKSISSEEQIKIDSFVNEHNFFLIKLNFSLFYGLKLGYYVEQLDKMTFHDYYEIPIDTNDYKLLTDENIIQFFSVTIEQANKSQLVSKEDGELLFLIQKLLQYHTKEEILEYVKYYLKTN